MNTPPSASNSNAGASDQPANAGLPEDDRPPIMGSWPRLYAFVLILHAVLIGVYYAISRLYS
jgi:hypothetical protein